MKNKTIPIIIPSYEPDDRLLNLLGDLNEKQLGPVVLVDDGSETKYQHYYDEAQQNFNCIIYRHAVNMGKGRALKDAFNYCLNVYPEMLGCVTADSDGQHTPADIMRCMEELVNYPDKLILGCRNFNDPQVPWKSQIGNKLTRLVCKLLCGLTISDTQTGLRAIPKAFMEHLLTAAGERFEFETQMLLESKDCFAIHEVIIETIYDSNENHQTHFDPVKDSIRIYKIFGKVFFKFVVSSLSSSVIDLLLFTLFCSLLDNVFVWYIAGATVMARLLSATYNYWLNYKIVFNSKQAHSKSTIRYIVLALLQMCCSAVVVTMGTMLLTFIHKIFIKIVVDTLLFLVSYIIQREFVFRCKYVKKS